MTIVDEGIDLNEELRKKFKEIDSVMNCKEELNNIHCKLRDKRIELREKIKRLKEDLSTDNYILCNIENLLETYGWEQ